MRLLLLVVLAAGLATHTRAQLFPFSNLHSYFKSMTRDGPGAETDADSESGVEAAQAAPAAVAAAAEPAPALAAPSRLAPAPAQELRPPANHRLEEDATPAEAAPVVGLRRLPYPSQDTAESGFAGVSAGAGLGSSDRVEFQMHGQQGPHTYKWGYDTGKGHNRQFRYEERDAHGHVKGHYGFYDKHGKLQVVNYSADPEHGYQADGNFGKHGIH